MACLRTYLSEGLLEPLTGCLPVSLSGGGGGGGLSVGLSEGLPGRPVCGLVRGPAWGGGLSEGLPGRPVCGLVRGPAWGGLSVGLSEDLPGSTRYM